MRSKSKLFFILLLVLFSLLYCARKSKQKEAVTRGEEKSNVPIIISSKSAIKTANEFVNAGINGDFKKLAGLCCKDNGPYITFEDVRYLNLGDLGFVDQIIREEKSEIDPDNLKLVVVRAKVLGEIGFYCFYAFITPAGCKIYLKGDYLWKYPPEKEALAKTAILFYATNKFNLKKAVEIAKHIVNLNPHDREALYSLGNIYSLMGRKEDALTQYKALLIEDRHYAEDKLAENDFLLACAELLMGSGKVPTVVIDKEIRYFIAEKLYNKRKDERAIPVLMEMWSEILFDKKSEEAAEMLVKIGGASSVPYLSKALKNKICVGRICKIFEELGDESAIPVLKEAVYFDGYYGGQLAAWPLAILSAKRGEKDLIIPIIKDALGNQLLVSPNYEIIGYLNALAYLTGDDNWKEFGNGNPHYSLSKISFVINAESYSKESDLRLLHEKYLDTSVPNYSNILDWVLNKWKEFRKEDESIELELEKILPNGPFDINLVFSVLHHIYERDGNKRKKLLDEGYFVIDNSKVSRVNLFGRGGFSSWDMRKYLEKNKFILKRISSKWIIINIEKIGDDESLVQQNINAEKKQLPSEEINDLVRAVGEIKPPKLIKQVWPIYRIPSKGWAAMIRKVYEVDPMVCPKCGGG